MGEILSITDIPADLKRFWIDEAKTNGRSIDEEIILVLQAARGRREPGAVTAAKDIAEIMEAARRLQNLPIRDNRSLEDILYDSDGMPK
jgi:hypothetical protein